MGQADERKATANRTASQSCMTIVKNIAQNCFQLVCKRQLAKWKQNMNWQGIHKN